MSQTERGPAASSSSSSIILGTRYIRADETWEVEGSNVITIVDYHLPTLVLCAIPGSFLQSSGDNSWAYVYHVIRCCVANGQGGMVVDGEGNEHKDDSRVEPMVGLYMFRNADPSRISVPSRGPQSNRSPKTGAPSLDLPSETISHSSRSTANQGRFKEGLVARDQVCLITEAQSPQCVAAHIVPQSRKDVYQELLGLLANIFAPSAGLLLRTDMHKRYDSYELALYFKSDAYYIHMFSIDEPLLHQYQGKRLDSNRFSRFVPPSHHPSKVLVNWHYRQAVMARFRGYAYGMEANRQGGDVPTPEGAPPPGPDDEDFR